MNVLVELAPQVKALAEEVCQRCERAGVTLLAYCAYRSPQQQAKLWRQSRTRAEVEAKAQKFRDRHLEVLAEILLGVGPQDGVLGQHVTRAASGESWHQYHEAFDAVPLVGGKAMWNASAPQWQIYGRACRDSGLQWAGDWEQFREFPHAQLRAGSNPLKMLTVGQVWEAMPRV